MDSVAVPVTSTTSRRTAFACVRCGSPTDAFSETERLELQVCRECYGKRADGRPRELNELSGQEWARASRSIERYPDTRSEKQRIHGASFPLSLARQQIEIYTRHGQKVLDPFLGVGTALDACEVTGRVGTGIELNPGFADLAKADLPAGTRHKVIVGDARQVLREMKEDTFDFVLTSPPYGALLKSVKGSFAFKWKEHSRLASIRNPAPYTDHEADLGNMEYPVFLQSLHEVLAETRRVMKSGAYAVWVVKDFRAVKAGAPLVNFHGDVIRTGEAAGLTLWDIRIVDQTQFRPLVCLGYPSRNFYLNIGHSYLVVLRKS